MKKNIPLLAVCGPTASGKTSLGIDIAKKYNGEIVSSDSMQIYKDMDIGTAKPTFSEMQGVVHHMFDIVPISSNYSVSDYCTRAHGIIENIHSRGCLPILAGGTGLYVDSLINDIDFSKGAHDENIRQKYLQIYNEHGGEYLWGLLLKEDREAAENIHANNTKRVIRALEHLELTGQKFSEYKQIAASRKSRYNSLVLYIDMDRQKLYERINRRVDIMIEAGLVDEAKKLYDMNYDRSLTAMCAIGYKELFEYFDGNITLEAAIDDIKQNSRRYAKRQMTWFRRNKDMKILSGEQNLLNQAVPIIEKWLEDMK